MKHPAVFFDRDGTLMEEVHYCKDPKDVAVFPGVPEALDRLKKRGFKTVIITNQSGIGRGIVTLEQYGQVHAELLAQLGPGRIDATYFCPDRPGQGSTRRKPEPGMVLEAARDLHIDLKHSYFVGDTAADIGCGRNAGLHTIHVRTGHGAKQGDLGADYAAENAIESIEYILRIAPSSPRPSALSSPRPPPRLAAIIPARWASTRFPGKPLHPIAGKPLIQHVWERCLAACEVDRVIIATDDRRIADAAAGFGAEVAMTSPRHRSGTDRVAEVAKKIPGLSHVINVQGDEPLIDPALINRLAKAFRTDPSLQMVTAANTATDDEAASPHVVKVVLDRASNALYFSRSPIPFFRERPAGARYYRHQGIYGYSTKFLLQFVKWKPTLLEKAESLEQLRALENGAKIKVLVTRSLSLGIDTPDDVESVAALLSRRRNPPRKSP